MLFVIETPDRPPKLLGLVLDGEAKDQRGGRRPRRAWVLGELGGELGIPWLCWCGLERSTLSIEDGDRPLLFASLRWSARAEAAKAASTAS